MDMVCVYLQNSGCAGQVTRMGCLALFGLLTGSCSDTSGPATPPATPSDVAATAIGPRTIQLTWTHTGGEVDLFRIERSRVGPVGPGAFREHATVTGELRSYTDPDLEEATQYEYRLQACRRDLCSTRSESVIASTVNPLRAFADRADDVSGPQIRIMAWPPNVPGQVAAMYLQAQPSGGSCAASLVSSPTAPPGYWEFAALHDLLHTFGIVSRSAPHHQDAYPAHVPENDDLMFTGAWMIGPTMIIDVGNDDYFGPDLSASLASLDASPYVAPPPVAITAPRAIQREMSIFEAASLRQTLRRLPMHSPFPR